MDIQRTHDQIYLMQDRKTKPKEYFKFILRKLEEQGSLEGRKTVLDVGCATGEFLYFLSSRYPQAEYFGIDVMKELLERAEKNNPKATFWKGDIFQNIVEDKDGRDIVGDLSRHFDLIFMLGVHSVFDDIRPVLLNLKSFLREEGKLYLFGIFNPYDLDVLIKSRTSNSQGAWETGWNLFSIDTVSNILDDLDLEYSYEPFRIDIDIEEDPKDPLRSYTVRMEDGSREVINGLQLVHKFYLWEIGRKK